MSAASKRGLLAAPSLALGLLLPVTALCPGHAGPGPDLNDGFETVMNFPMPDGISVDSHEEDEGSSRDLIIVPIPKSSPSLDSASRWSARCSTTPTIPQSRGSAALA
jgi:hypothetical protein